MILTIVCIYIYLLSPGNDDSSSSCCNCECNWLKRKKDWLLTKLRKYAAEINAFIGLFGLGLHWWDIVSDFSNFLDYVHNGDVWYAFWTLVFILVPMLPAFLACLDLVCAAFNHVSLTKVISVLLCFTVSPLTASYLIAREIYFKYRKEFIDIFARGIELGPKRTKLMRILDMLFFLTAESESDYSPDAMAEKEGMIMKIGAILKLWEVMGESYPQGVLQSFIVSQYKRVGKHVTSSQWMGIASSVISLAFSMTTHRLFDQIGREQEGLIKVAIKLGLFVRFLLSVSSRISVACIFAMGKFINIEQSDTSSIVNALQFGIVIITEGFSYFAVSMVSNIYRSHQTRATSQIDSKTSKSKDSPATQALWTSLFSTPMDSITISGCVVSIVNFAFAVGGWFLDEVPESIRIVGITLSSITLFFNLISAFIPFFKEIRTDFKQGMDMIFE